jgi:hypothetical protein
MGLCNSQGLPRLFQKMLPKERLERSGKLKYSRDNAIAKQDTEMNVSKKNFNFMY